MLQISLLRYSAKSSIAHEERLIGDIVPHTERDSIEVASVVILTLKTVGLCDRSSHAGYRSFVA